MSPTENQTSPDPPTSKHKRKTFSQRIFSRMNDLIAIFIVLFAGLTMGDSVLEWWNTSPEQAIQLSKERLAEDLSPPDLLTEKSVRIESGLLDIGFERLALNGSPDDVGKQMIARLARQAQRVGMPSGEPEEREQAMLKVVEDETPIWTDDLGLAIYYENAPLAAYVAVRENSGTSQNVSQKRDARVVSWGFVIPEGESRWTGWLFSPKGQSGVDLPFEWKSMLPDGANCELGFHSESEQVFLSFSGTGSLKRWRAEFEDQLSRREFALVEGWSSSGSSTSAEFLRISESGSQTLSIHIQTESHGRLRGLLNVTRPHEESP